MIEWLTMKVTIVGYSLTLYLVPLTQNLSWDTFLKQVNLVGRLHFPNLIKIDLSEREFSQIGFLQNNALGLLFWNTIEVGSTFIHSFRYGYVVC